MLQMSRPCLTLCGVGQSQQGSPEPCAYVPVLGQLVGTGVVPQKASEAERGTCLHCVLSQGSMTRGPLRFCG